MIARELGPRHSERMSVFVLVYYNVKLKIHWILLILTQMVFKFKKNVSASKAPKSSFGIILELLVRMTSLKCMV